MVQDALALEKKTLQILSDPQTRKSLSWEAIKRALRHCDSGVAEAPTLPMHVSSWPPDTRVNLGACAADIQIHRRRSYSNFDTAAQEQLALQASVRGSNQQFGCGLGGDGEG